MKCVKILFQNAMKDDLVFEDSTSAPIIEEIILLELKIDQKEREADDLVHEIETLQSSLDAFLANYYSRVGKLYVELDQIKLQVQEYHYRFHLFEQDPGDQPDWTGYDKEVDEAFAYQRERVLDLEGELNEFVKFEEINRYKKTQNDPTLKSLFRKLAFHFHPDRAQSTDEHELFHEMMSCINAAYEKGDLETLQKYSRKLSLEERLKDEVPETLLNHLKDVYEQVFVFIKQLKVEKEAILMNESYKMKIKVDEALKVGRDLLNELARDAQEQIKSYQQELQALKQDAKDIEYPGALYG